MKKKFLSSILFILIDFIVIFGLSLLTFFSSYQNDLFSSTIKEILIFCSSLTVLTILLLFANKQYKLIVSNFGLADSLRIGLCILGTHIVGLVCCLLIKPLNFNPKLWFVWLLEMAAVTFIICALRALPREIKTLKVYISKKTNVRTIIIGAGSAAKIVIDDTRINKDNVNKIVALVDDDVTKQHMTYSNIPVDGPINNIGEIIKKYNAEQVIIAIANLSEERLHEILDYLSVCDVRVRRMPLLTEMNGPNDIKIVDVHIDDLLNRKVVLLENKEVTNMINKKTVLVTGAGGSIGSELVRQIFNTHPSTLILFDIYENSTYEIQQELVRKIRKDNIKDIKIVTLIGSTYNDTRIEQVIKKYRPDYIYHAAAYKHVPLMEDSPAEAIRTNVIGTYNVARLADKYDVKKMVLVSTDKAVRPTNVMGATKRFAETIIQYFSDKSKNTAYAAVRFGNVLGSNGSVVPLFKKQIEEGGPITLTHKDIIRYFMTIPEAVSLILQCGLYAKEGEIFILDMGKPVKIYDLAVKLIRQAGLVPEKDIKIIENGLRPGEKLFEELLLDVTSQTKTNNERIFIEKKESIKPIEDEIVEISKVFNMEETDSVKELLSKIIDTYTITK